MKELSVWKISDKLFTKSEKDIKKLLKQIRKEILDCVYDSLGNDNQGQVNKVFDKYLKKD